MLTGIVVVGIAMLLGLVLSTLPRGLSNVISEIFKLIVFFFVSLTVFAVPALLTTYFNGPIWLNIAVFVALVVGQYVAFYRWLPGLTPLLLLRLVSFFNILTKEGPSSAMRRTIADLRSHPIPLAIVISIATCSVLYILDAPIPGRFTTLSRGGAIIRVDNWTGKTWINRFDGKWHEFTPRKD